MKEHFTIVHEGARDRACEVINSLSFSEPHEVIIRPYKSSRSLAQNNLLHKWCAHISQAVAESHGKFYPAEHWKEYLKAMFLGEETITMGKKTLTRTRKTSELKVGEFAQFLTDIDHYSGAQLKIWLPHPDEYHQAMGGK